MHIGTAMPVLPKVIGFLVIEHCRFKRSRDIAAPFVVFALDLCYALCRVCTYAMEDGFCVDYFVWLLAVLSVVDCVSFSTCRLFGCP